MDNKIFTIYNFNSESSLRVIMLPSLVYPYFDLDFEQDEIRKAALLIKQETEWLNNFVPFCWSLVFWTNSHRRRLSDRVRLLKKCVGGKVRSVRGKKLACLNPFDTPDRLGIAALEYDEER